jgi:hypothetical protein
VTDGGVVGLAIGVDIGGTKLAARVVDDHGRIHTLAPTSPGGDGRRSGQASIGGAAPYSSSLTCSPQLALLPSSSTWSRARWVMKRVGAAPCQ